MTAANSNGPIREVEKPEPLGITITFEAFESVFSTLAFSKAATCHITTTSRCRRIMRFQPPTAYSTHNSRGYLIKLGSDIGFHCNLNSIDIGRVV